MAIDFKRLSERDRDAVSKHFSQTAPARPSKYNAVKTEASGRVFDSKKEAGRYVQLEALERAGIISQLERQVRYSLDVNGVTLGYYVCDYRYKSADGQTIVEDAKGKLTQMYIWKRRHMVAQYGITILET